MNVKKRPAVKKWGVFLFFNRPYDRMFRQKLFSSLLLTLVLIATQCQPASPEYRSSQLPTSPPTPTQEPTPILYPPIQPGDGSDLIDRLLETGVIRVGIRVWPEALFSPPAFRGFSNAATGGALNGFEVEIAHLLAERLGLDLELVQAYPPVIASGDWRGQWDIALASLVPFDQPPPAAPAQVQPLFFSEPYGYMPMGILIPADENNIQSLANLSGKKVGVLEYSPAHYLLISGDPPPTVRGQPVLDQPPADIQVIPVSNLSKAIRQLAGEEDDEAPQLDAIFGPTPILQQAVVADWPVKLAPQATNIGLQPLVVAVVAQDDLKVDRLLMEINQIFHRLHQRGTLSEIYLDWYGQDYSQIPTPVPETTPTP